MDLPYFINPLDILPINLFLRGCDFMHTLASRLTAGAADRSRGNTGPGDWEEQPRWL